MFYIIEDAKAKLNGLSIFDVLRHQEYYMKIAGILKYNLTELSDRQLVRLYDFVNDLPMYTVYTKQATINKAREVRNKWMIS